MPSKKQHIEPTPKVAGNAIALFITELNRLADGANTANISDIIIIADFHIALLRQAIHQSLIRPLGPQEQSDA